VSQLTYAPVLPCFPPPATQEGTMKLNPRKLLEDYDALVWSGLFLAVVALWALLFVVAILHTAFL
jgi:hypothetical protein